MMAGFKLKYELLQACICCAVAVCFQSRSFVLGYFASISFLLLANYNFKFSRRSVLTIIFSIFFCGIILGVFFKTDSSFGRLFIYKISVNIWNDHFFRGIGWSKFSVIYGQYQIEYFKSGVHTTKELLLADNTSFAFNDYLEFAIEMGLVGLIILGLAFLFIIKSTSVALNKHSGNPAILYIAISQLVAISIAAAFTHVFEKYFFLQMYVIGLIIICKYAYGQNFMYFTRILLALSVICLASQQYGNHLWNIGAYDKMKDARRSFKSGFRRESLSIYESLYPKLKSDVMFLNEYAGVASSLGLYDRAEIINEAIIKINNFNIFYQKLGDSYFQTKKMDKAEEAYLNAVYRVPNRFGSRFALFNFYIATNQKKKAFWCGRTILNLPVKVKSAEVTNIKQNVAATLMTMTNGS